MPILQTRKLETRKSFELAQAHTVATDRAGSSLPGHPAPGHSSRLQRGGRKHPSPPPDPTPNPLNAGLSQESVPQLPTPTSPHFPCCPSCARSYSIFPAFCPPLSPIASARPPVLISDKTRGVGSRGWLLGGQSDAGFSLGCSFSGLWLRNLALCCAA